MSQGIINLRLLGRLGNNLFQYAFAHFYCKQHGFELRCPDWVGHRLFNLPPPIPYQERFTTVRSELDFIDGEPNIELYGYFQHQRAMIYTRQQVRGLFHWRSELVDKLCASRDPLLAHVRHGDYLGYGYPVVSRKSYILACEQHGLPVEQLVFISEDNPTPGPSPEFTADFYRLSRAHTLLRANSSFSWWAATLAEDSQDVYSPVIEGLAGGAIHDVPFVQGNHPRFTNLDFVTDLTLTP